jgi:hypothetical protein
MERLRHWKKQKGLTNRAVCLKCNPQEETKHRKEFSQKFFICNACGEDLATACFENNSLRRALDKNSMHLLVCRSCTCSGREVEEQEATCRHCQQTMSVTEMVPYKRKGTAFGKDAWTCKACAYPACTGCGIRRTEAQVGTYTCNGCMYPPCIKCKRTPRPQTGKYSVTNVPEWTCMACWPKCLGCGSMRQQNKRYSPLTLPEWRCPQCRAK